MGSKDRHIAQTSSGRRGCGGLPRMVSSRRMKITGKLTGGSTRFLSRLASAKSLVDSGDGATETSSVCSSVCNKSLDSAIQHTGITTISTSKANKKKKQRVRFNDNKFTGKNQVNSTVICIERVGDRDRSEVWWTAKEIWAARSEEALMAENDSEAIAYLSASFQVFLLVTAEDREDATKCTPNAQDLAICLDARYRGLERWHGPSSVDRKFRCEQVTQDIVRMYRKSIKHQQQNIKEVVEVEEAEGDVDERVRCFAHNLTVKMQNLARFYGKIDSLGVNNNNNTNDGKDDDNATTTTTTTAEGESS